jgi:hypothetical protein
MKCAGGVHSLMNHTFRPNLLDLVAVVNISAGVRSPVINGFHVKLPVLSHLRAWTSK